MLNRREALAAAIGASVAGAGLSLAQAQAGAKD